MLTSASEDDVVLRLDVRGPATITAGDIKCPADVEILNPELHLATLNSKGRLAVDLTVSQTDKTNRWSVHSTFSGINAATDVVQNGQNERRNLTITPDSVVLPNLIFGSYEALAARLSV